MASWSFGMLAAVAVTAVLALGQPAQTAQAIKVDRVVAVAFSFTPVDVSIEEGFFKKHGVEVSDVERGPLDKPRDMAKIHSEEFPPS